MFLQHFLVFTLLLSQYSQNFEFPHLLFPLTVVYKFKHSFSLERIKKNTMIQHLAIISSYLSRLTLLKTFPKASLITVIQSDKSFINVHGFSD